jgi:hypothetical protein
MLMGQEMESDTMRFLSPGLVFYPVACRFTKEVMRLP